MYRNYPRLESVDLKNDKVDQLYKCNTILHEKPSFKMLLIFNFYILHFFLEKSWGRDGGQVVSVLAFNSVDPTSNPARPSSLFL